MRIAVDGIYFGMLPKRSWKDLIALCKQVGADGLNCPVHTDYLNPDDPAMVDAVIEALQEANLAVLSLGITKQMSAEPGAEQEFREYIAQAAEIAPRVGCKVLDCWPRKPEGVSKQQAQETLADNMRAVAPVAEKAGCVVALEFEPDTTVERYQEAYDFVKQFSPAIRLTADTYHIVRIGDKLTDCANTIIDRIGIAHLSGSHRGEVGSEGDTCDHAAFVEALSARGYSNDYVLQYAPPEDAAASLTRAVEFSRRLL